MGRPFFEDFESTQQDVVEKAIKPKAISIRYFDFARLRLLRSVNILVLGPRGTPGPLVAKEVIRQLQAHRTYESSGEIGCPRFYDYTGLFPEVSQHDDIQTGLNALGFSLERQRRALDAPNFLWHFINIYENEITIPNASFRLALQREPTENDCHFDTVHSRQSLERNSLLWSSPDFVFLTDTHNETHYSRAFTNGWLSNHPIIRDLTTLNAILRRLKECDSYLVLETRTGEMFCFKVPRE